MPLVNEELRKLAAAKMAQEKPGQTLQATAVVHEAYIRLDGAGQSRTFEGRANFFAATAEAMRKILIEKASRKHRVIHGEDRQRVNLDSAIATTAMSLDDLLAITGLKQKCWLYARLRD